MVGPDALKPAQCQDMITLTDLASVPSHPSEPFTDRLRLAVAAYLARFKGPSREHTESDLRCYLAWCPAARTRGRHPTLPMCVRLGASVRGAPNAAMSRSRRAARRRGGRGYIRREP